MTLTPDLTLAEIVTRWPDSARTLESVGLDYCCGGRRSLSDACEAADLDPRTVIDLVDQTSDAPEAEWATMGPGELVDHIESVHHQYLHAELPRLSALANKVAEVHGDRHPELREVRSLYSTLRDDLAPHLIKEEQVLFPMIRELDAAETSPRLHCGSLQSPIAVMTREHDRAGELLAALRRATDGYRTPADGCASYQALYDGLAELEADTHLHVHKENNLLFPAAVSMEAERSTPAPH